MPPSFFDGLNIIACPSCSRVENEAFIGLAEEVREMTAYAAEPPQWGRELEVSCSS